MAAWAIAGSAAAQTPAPLTNEATAELERRCWSSRSFERTRVDLREPFAVSFGNLRNGMTVASPFWVDFGIRGMGVIAAGNVHPKAGHHHLLVDTPLPLDHQAKIPFNDRHRHFGKGQTGTLLDLPPGEHTLRLLFADHDHRPYFVYSPEVKITVAGRRADAAPAVDAKAFDASCARWYDHEVTRPRGEAKQAYVRNLRAGETVGGSFTIGLGAIGFGVAPAGTNVKDSGWFAMDIAAAGAKGRTLRVELKDGRTETVLDLNPGDYTVTPMLVGADGKPLVAGAALPIVVAGGAR